MKQYPVTLYLCIYLLLAGLCVCGAATADESVPFDSPRWHSEAQKVAVEGHGVGASILLKGGTVWLDGVSVLNAEVSFEVNFGPERGFLGLAFRGQDARNYEHFYVRPHQSGNPDANQYTPVFNGVSAWQLYHGPDYSSPKEYPYDEWFKIRVVFAGDRAEVWIGDDKLPTVKIPDLKRPSRPGKLGVTSNFAPARFRNFHWRAIDSWEWAPPLAARQPSDPDLPMSIVTSFEVSSPLPEVLLEKHHELDSELPGSLTWKRAMAEATGLLNLAAYADRGADRKNDTVLVRHLIQADHPVAAEWTIGFSDRIRVYCDGRLAYLGQNDYQSRDYRFLGTIGWFDTVICPLSEGSHEIVFAVSESFGGWGLMVSETLRELSSLDPSKE